MRPPCRIVLPILIAASFGAAAASADSSEIGVSPVPEDAKAALTEVRGRYAGLDDGAVADYIPELSKANPADFGIALVGVDGTVETVGEADSLFTIQSIAKPFVYALALSDHGSEEMVSKVGVEPTGLPFNSILPTEVRNLRTQNPLVNAGAIATASLVKGGDPAARYKRTEEFLSAFAGDKLKLDEAVYKSEMATNKRNMSIAYLLDNYGLLYSDVDDAVERYTRTGCLLVSARSLAVMGATLANGGVNPLTDRRVIDSGLVTDVLSVMAMAGMYDYSGEWLFRVGLPAKSGVGGGIVAVVPGRFAIATFSPRLDANGNSVRGIRAMQDLSKRWNLHEFAP